MTMARDSLSVSLGRGASQHFCLAYSSNGSFRLWWNDLNISSDRLSLDLRWTIIIRWWLVLRYLVMGTIEKLEVDKWKVSSQLQFPPLLSPISM